MPRILVSANRTRQIDMAVTYTSAAERDAGQTGETALLDPLEMALGAARERWRLAKAAGYAPTYWQQTPTGWTKKE